jgi:RNA polymerase sigma factor (sigma-70 family)
MNDVITHLRTLIVEGDGARLTDGQLLECFVSRRDAAALEALVRRHGPMVWGVCRRVLPNYHDAEDAFQATFLVLVRKAASITSRDLVANWIYAVAAQTALKARATAAKRRSRERQVAEVPEPAVAERTPWSDLRPLLDRELSRLPHKYRAVIVLCDLEGQSRKEAAQQLGVPEGTIASRMAAARAMLAKRLARHGLAVSVASLASGLTEHVATAGVPTSVVSATIAAANVMAAGATAGAVSVEVIALTDGVIKAMMMTRLKTAGAALLLMLGIAALGGGLFILRTPAAQKPPPAQPQVQAEAAKPDDPPDNATAQPPKLRATMDVHFLVTSLAFSPDGKTLASGSYGNTAKLWEVATGEERANLAGHTNAVNAVAFSPDGKTLASGSDDKTIKLWDVKTGTERATLIGHPNGVASLAYSPDGKTLASASHGTIKLWDTETGKERAALPGCRFVVYSPDGKTLATKFADGTVRLWDVKTGKERAILKGPAGCLAFSPDGKTLAMGGSNSVGSWERGERNTLKLWDVETGMLTYTLDAMWDVDSLAYSPDGKTLALYSYNVVLWEVATRKERFALETKEAGNYAVVFSPDGKTLAAAGKCQKIRLWDLKPVK